MPQPNVGQMYLYSDCRPPLEGGRYTLKVSQTLVKSGGDRADTGSRPLPGPREHAITIDTPRFTLGATDLHSVFPPQNSEGHFAARLPMAVLGRRTLPWERTLDGSTPVPGSTKEAWLAVLLLDSSEIRDDQNAGGVVDFLDPPNCTVAAVVDGSPAEGVSPLTMHTTVRALERQLTCSATELPVGFFQRIAPMLTELPFLTHVRQVNTDDKELLGLDEDGWFAIVVCNRIPLAGHEYVACLVSLEGVLELLPAGPTAVLRPNDLANAPPAPAPSPRVRVVTLARWRFKCVPGGNFQELMEALPYRDRQPPHGGVAMFGENLETATIGAQQAEGAQVALDSGHLPLEFLTRAGERTVAWYRGPFAPASVARETAGPYHSADQARRVDPVTGLENLGYAAAFEIGRLLALSDPRFALELLRWRRDGGQLLARSFNLATLKAELPDFRGEMDIDRFLSLPAQIAEQLIADFGIRARAGNLLGPLADPTGLAEQMGNMPGLDPAQVSTAMQLAPGVVTELLAGSMMGSGGRLDGLGVRDLVPLDSDLTSLSNNAAREFAELGSVRDEMLDAGERGGF